MILRQFVALKVLGTGRVGGSRRRGGDEPGGRARSCRRTPPNLMDMSFPSPQTVRFWNRQTLSMFFIAGSGSPGVRVQSAKREGVGKDEPLD